MRGVESMGRVLAMLVASTCWAQVTQRVSLSTEGVQMNGYAGRATVTPDGRYVAFDTYSSNLVPGDTNDTWDVFVRDRRTGTTESISVARDGTQGNGLSWCSAISADGRFVTFVSLATNLIVGDTNARCDVFVRDRQNGTTERVSLSSTAEQGNGDCHEAQASSDARFVVFASNASNLAPDDTNSVVDIFVRDRETGRTERVSTDSNGAQAAPSFFEAYGCAISNDGRYVAFVSDAQNLVSGDTNWAPDVFVKDRSTGVTERVSVSSSGTQQSYDFLDVFGSCVISDDGRYVGFNTPAGDLVTGDNNDWFDGFVHDRQTGITERVTVDSDGLENANGGWLTGLSADARFVSFSSWSDLVPVPGSPNVHADAFVRDRRLGSTERVSVSSSGVPANLDSGPTAISLDGRFVVVTSKADNLVPGDTNVVRDVFVRDRFGGTNFTSLCDPGVAGVVACPCANPPTGSGRGCDNSAGTGGAALTASGGTFLSSDSFVLRATRTTPGTLGIALQGDALVASGTAFGQGVRCASGLMRRLFVKTAIGGSVTVPDFDAGDQSISARSAAKGDLIHAGETRWYFVYYRDPIVLGGCPPINTFNATQTGQVTWSP